LDLIGRDFLLLTGAQGDAHALAAAEAAKRLGVGLDVYRLGSDLDDPDGAAATAYRLPPAGAVLVRPDGFVAWRSADAAEHGDAAVGQALARALCRTLA
jgi:putative polyketide hydroxylase